MEKSAPRLSHCETKCYLRAYPLMTGLLEQREVGGGDAAPQPLPDPSMAPQRQEQRAAIREALQSLPPGQRNALALRHVEGFSYIDIAEALGLQKLVDMLPEVVSKIERARTGDA